MSRIFKEIALTAKRPLTGNDSRIEYMSRVVCALFVKGMPKIKTNGFWKLSIRFNYGEPLAKNGVSVDIYTFYADFPVDEFLTWPLGNQQEFMLGFVSNAVSQAFGSEGIDVSFVASAIEYVRNNNFLNIFEGKGKLSPYENVKARIVCEQDMLEARIYMEVGERGKVERYFLERCAPDEFHIQIYFGRIDWLNSRKLVLNVIDGRLIEVSRDHGPH
jgi:hypothetical protein